MEPEYERRCVIFNYTEIRGLKPREGTEKDVEVIENTFEELNFRVDIHHDLPITKLKATLNALKTGKNCVCLQCLTNIDNVDSILQNRKKITMMLVVWWFSFSLMATRKVDLLSIIDVGLAHDITCIH